MTQTETLRLALEALRVTWYHVGTFAPTDEAIELYDEAITAIKAALANEALERKAENARELGLDYEPLEAKDEPVAWMRTSGTGSPVVTEALLSEMPEMRWNFQKPLYTTPPHQEAKDEPVAWREFDGEGGYYYSTYEDNEDYAVKWDAKNPKHKGWVEPLYTTPPQRTWVGLTDEHKEGLICMTDPNPQPHHLRELIDVVEFQLKEKNT